jgi:hypothetical protein
VCHLSRRIYVEAGDVGDHPAEQGDIDRMPGAEHFAHGQIRSGFLERLVIEGGELCRPGCDQVDQPLELSQSEEQQVGGLGVLLTRLDVERSEDVGGDPGGLFVVQAGAVG